MDSGKEEINSRNEIEQRIGFYIKTVTSGRFVWSGCIRGGLDIKGQNMYKGNRSMGETLGSVI